MASEKAFVNSAIQGIIIAIVFSFVVLIISTNNILTAFLGILCISFVIISVLSIMVLQEWNLGASESIAIVILMSLSIDYVIYLAHVYSISVLGSRHEKMKQAYLEMAVSILSGTLTTLCSGIVLFGGRTISFQKFAVVIMSTIIFSCLSSMFLFGALCHFIGPQRATCNVKILLTPKKTK